MNKYLILLVTLALSAKLNAQNETFPSSGTVNNRVFKVYNTPKEDKTDLFEITGIGSTNFTASNVSDGSTNSFNHNIQIIVTLNASKAGGNSFQLNFYNNPNNIQQAASFTEGVLNIYYPVELYESIRSRLEQNLAAKKKVTVKVIQKTNGYREGTLAL